MNRFNIIFRAFLLGSMLILQGAVFHSFAQAQEKKEPLKLENYTLEQCIEHALEHDINIKNAQIDNQISKAKVGEVRAIGLPQVNGNLQLADYFKVPKAFLPGEILGGEPGTFVPVEFQPQFSGQFSLQATQLIFDGSYFLGLKAASTYTELSEKAIGRSKVDVVEKVMKAFLGILIQDERIKLIDQNIKRLDSLQYQTKMMFENGFVEEIDVDRLTVTVNNLKSERNKFERLQALSKEVLKFQMNLDVEDQLTIKGSLADYSPEAGIDGSIADPSLRPEYQILKVQESLNMLQIKSYKVGYMPSLGVSLSYGSNVGTNTFGDIFNIGDKWFGNAMLGFNLKIPIFDGMMKSYQVQQGKLELLKTQNTIKQFERVVHLENRQAQLMLSNHLETLQIQKKNMEIAEKVFRVAKIKYQEGVGSNIEILESETALKEAQTNYYSALYDAMITKIDLQKANGTLIQK